MCGFQALPYSVKHKILFDHKYDMVAVPNLTTLTILITRGNDLKLRKTRTTYDA